MGNYFVKDSIAPSNKCALFGQIPYQASARTAEFNKSNGLKFYPPTDFLWTWCKIVLKVNELLSGLTKAVHHHSAVMGKNCSLPQAAAVDRFIPG